MVHPVRFGSGFSGYELPDPPGYKVVYTAPHHPGEQFILHSMLDAEADEQRVVLKEGGFGDGVGGVDFASAESVTRYGSRVLGMKVPAFTGSLDVVVRPGPDESVVETLRDWRNAWSYFEDGKLKVIARDGGEREARVRLVEFGEVEVDPSGVTLIEDSVQYRCLDGYWTGGVVTYTGNVTVTTPGDLPPKLRLRWDGQTTAFSLPSGLSLSLATGPGVRWIDLERGMQGQVTDEDGNVDTGTWSSLRGVLVGETLQPHTKNDFQLGAGLTLEVTPRYLSPWR
ncbi:hypothetical protein HMPREF3158_05405 [Corynebacterium sp. HMSC06G04]|uniref:hypothetical protein n=1 Tax=Corynebacterium sp. HMSC06G04 TaxID=1581126 RepID=UPI0008A22566|nr:hypothetical protein [Corynebacterium sp. HMSC06G04]OFT46980.1 hypothetical protein HMPREF3158_05405 [Corynebacterium sp. HMSC06G04]